MPTLQYPNNPNTDTAFVVQDDGTKNRALMTAPQDTSTLELPSNPNSTKGYVTVNGKKQRVVLTADISGAGGDQHNLGYYATLTDLQTAHPTAEAGDWAIVGATDTVWIWDTDNSQWVDSDQKGQVTSVNNQTGAVTITADDILPSQTGNAGKFLTTDGTDASWSDKPLVNTSVNTSSLTIQGLAQTSTVSNSINVGVNSKITAGTDGAYCIAIGRKAQINSNGVIYKTIVIGDESQSNVSDSIVVGAESSASSSAQFGIAMGYRANVSAAGAIQLNASNNISTNSDANTFKVANANGNFEIMSANGTIPESRLADTTNAQQGDVLTLDANGDAVWQAGSGGLPSQTGNSGKFLTTDGTDASWATINALQNTATGTNALTILGTAATNTRAINIGAGSSVTANDGVAIGAGATAALAAIAIGRAASAGITAMAIGWDSKATANHAIQLGYSKTNSDANTFKVGNINGNYEMMSADGTIPTDRFTTTPSADGTYVPTLTISSGVATRSWSAPSGGGSTGTTASLVVANWSSNTQTVNVTGVTASNNVIVAPAPASQADYTAAGIICTAQGAGTLTFTCTTVPSSAITVNVLII